VSFIGNPSIAIQIIYKLITLGDLAIFVWLVYFFRNNLFAILVLLISLISYPFIHELERGQWNFICSALVFIGLLTKRPVVALLSISLALQLKIFPFLFLPLILKREYFNWKFFIAFTILNFGLFFVMGTEEFLRFIHTQTHNSSISAKGWEMNPSIDSFIDMVSTVINYPLSHFYKWIVLLPIFGALLLQFNKVKSALNEANIFLLTSIFIILAIPLSYDYRLSILIIPFVYFVSFMGSENINKKTTKGSYLQYILYCIYLYLMLKVTYIAHGFVSFTKHFYPTLNSQQYITLSQLLGSRFIPLFMLCFFCIVFIQGKSIEKRVSKK
jgi:hypothetical protein